MIVDDNVNTGNRDDHQNGDKNDTDVTMDVNE